MAASGYTPISLYYSNSAGVSPTAGNLVNGELALNIPDGKLYYKDGVTVKLLASNAGATGTVSSVAASVPAFLSVSGSPITTSGTLAITYSGTALPVANGGTNATSAGISAFNNITGYSASGATGTTSTNLVFSTSPTLVTPNLGTPSAATLTNATGLPLTTGVTGTLPVANGGTGSTTLTANNVLLGNGTSALQVVAPGTSGNILTSNGTTWTSSAPAAAGGSITATASGSISAGAPVILDSSGQAVAVTNTISSTWNQPNSQSTFAASTSNGYTVNSSYSCFNKIAYGTTSGRTNAYWIGAPYLFRSYFTTSGYTLTFGSTSTVYTSAVGGLQYTSEFGISSVIYSSSVDRYFGLFTTNSDTRKLRVFSDSDADAYAATQLLEVPSYSVSSTYAYNYELASNATGSKIVAVWLSSNSGSGTLDAFCCVGTTNSTSPYVTWGSATVVATDVGASQNQLGVAMNSSGTEFVVAYAAPAFPVYTYCALFSVSGTTATLRQTISPASTSTNDYRSEVGRRSVMWMPSQSAYVVTWWVNGASSSNANYLVAAACTSSGTALTFGSPTQIAFNSTTSQWGENFMINLPVTPGYFIIACSSLNYQQCRLVGTTITITLSGAYLSGLYNGYGYNSDTGQWSYFYGGSTTVNLFGYGSYTTNMSNNFVGFSAASYTTGQTATVTVVSGTNTSQSGLTPGTRYYIQPTGTLGLASTSNYAGQALSSTSILVKG